MFHMSFIKVLSINSKIVCFGKHTTQLRKTKNMLYIYGVLSIFACQIISPTVLNKFLLN